LAAAGQIAEARAVATIAAPSDPGHVTGLFKDQVADIRQQGEGEVVLAGRPFRIRREFLDDVAEQNLLERVRGLSRALLVMHSPTDDMVGIDNATRIFLAARHPKSFVTLTDADHLLTRRRDALYAANVIAAWAERYVETAPGEATSEEARLVTVSATGEGKFQQAVVVGPHRLLADEPVAAGGMDTGLAPYDLLSAALGACSAMTLRLYADQKGLPLTGVTVTLSHAKIHAADCATCETKEGKIDRIDRTIALEGPLDEAQRKRLIEIADKCPVHRTLTSEVEIRTALAP
jgi:putative redox protein